MNFLSHMLAGIHKLHSVHVYHHVHGVLVDKGFDAVLCFKRNMLIACVPSHLMVISLQSKYAHRLIFQTTFSCSG